MNFKPIKTGSSDVNFTHSDGFIFFSCSNVFSPQSYLALQQAFTMVPWVKKQTDFYKQYESLITASQNNLLYSLYKTVFYLGFKREVEKVLKTKLRDEIRIIAHKLVTADEIDVHNDYCDPSLGYENYRFIFQFAFPNQPISGGNLHFLSSSSKKTSSRNIFMILIQVFTFKSHPNLIIYISAVTGERYTLIMYLWNKDSPYDGSGITVI